MTIFDYVLQIFIGAFIALILWVTVIGPQIENFQEVETRLNLTKQP